MTIAGRGIIEVYIYDPVLFDTYNKSANLKWKLEVFKSLKVAHISKQVADFVNLSQFGHNFTSQAEADFSVQKQNKKTKMKVSTLSIKKKKLKKKNK